MNKENIKRIFLILLLIISVVLTACGAENSKIEEESVNNIEEKETLEIEDDFGKTYTVEEPVERIISLSPSSTEILFSLGLDDEILGVTTYCNYPEKALEKEKVGSYVEVNLEKIMELEPEVIIAEGLGEKEAMKQLESSGIAVLSFDPNTIEEVIDVIKRIGIITGKEDNAEKITEEMISRKNTVIEKLKGTEKVRVFYEVWNNPLQAAGPGSFMDNIIELANGNNIAKDTDSPYPEYDLEQLIQKDPEVYLTTKDMEEKTVESIKQRPGYEEITAIKKDRIYLLDGDITSRPGPRIIEALEIVAKILHPEVFE